MAFVNIVALHVTDQESYSLYRKHMTPLLTRCGGSFQFDVAVTRDLKHPEREINRLFAIQFPDRATREQFFADPRYQAIRTEFFNPAVSATYRLGEGDMLFS